MYLVGDKVVHPMHGAGVIRDIVEERLAGQRKSYYVFSLPLIGKSPQLSVEMTVNWNQRYRENMDRLKSGQLVEVAQVIKALMWRDRDRGLSNGERKMLHSAKQILLSEVVLVNGTDYKETEQQIDRIMLHEGE